MTSYVIITPAFNEANYIGKTIDSVLGQTVRPLIWVIVDDGSSDKTWEIINDASQKHPWIVAYHQFKNGQSNADGLVTASEAIAFLRGYDIAIGKYPNPGLVVKLDADLKFSPDYFKLLIDEFDSDETLGIAGGVIYEYKGKNLIREKISMAHVPGAQRCIVVNAMRILAEYVRSSDGM